MDYNQAIQVLRNAIDCIECEDCVRECCTYYDMAINKDSMLAALDLAIECIEKYADLRSCGAKSRPIDADRLSLVLQKNFGHTDAAEVMQQIINAQPTLDDVIEEQGHEIRLVIDGLKDLIADRKSFVQEPGDIFSRDIEILERAVTLIQQSDKPNQKLRSSHGDSRRIVRCNRCSEWLGWEDELAIKDDVEQCPHCGASDALMDVDSGCNFSETEIRELWSMFGDIPMNPETECMEEPFLDFKSGTSREDIWHWFDKKYPGGLHELIYGMDK